MQFTKKKQKKYNRMIHTLPYSEYTSALNNAGIRNHVNIIFVNPYNSSKNATKYSYRKLNRHQGASYIIARRAMQFKD